ncbi:MAG: MbnP family copper-binding protein [bacterium]
MRSLTRTMLAALLLAAAPAFGHVDIPGLDVDGQCVGDQNSDSAVAINELILAVNNALDGCPRRPVAIQFKGMVGDKAFACGTAYDGIGTGNSQFVPADFRLYVSNLRLVKVTGEEVPITLEQDGIWQYQDVAMLDFEDGTGPCANGNSATNTVVKGSVPSGVYTGIKYDLGLPFDLDHGNASTAPSPLNFSAMFWSWQSGYKFLRVDTADDKYRIHLGSTGCGGGSPSQPPPSCSAPNVGAVNISDFNPDHSIIAADLKTLLAASDIDVNEDGTPPGCMADPDDAECQPLVPRFGLTFPGGQPNAATQQFFHVLQENDAAPHVEIFAASSTDGGGALVAHAEFDTTQAVPLFFSECLGGTGAECDGGTRLFTAVNPGISPLDASEPDEAIYALGGGTVVSLAVTAIDPGLTIRFGDVVLDSAGDSVDLGTTPEFHADLEAQLALPGGEEPSGTFSASLKLTTTSATYTASEVFTIKYTPKDSAAPSD